MKEKSRKGGPGRRHQSLAYLFLDDGSVRVPLTHGMFAFIDHDDFEKVSLHLWSWYRGGGSNRVGYAMANIKTDGRWKKTFLHRLILGPKPHERVDHRDRNGLNCRRSNLRISTGSGNQCNTRPHLNGTSRFKGVSRHRGTGKWIAWIGMTGKHHYLGVFLIKEEAARAYDAAAKKLHGQFAYLNFPDVHGKGDA